MEVAWGTIGAAGVIVGIIIGISGHLRAKREKDERRLAEQYRDGVEEGSLQKDMEFLKTNSVEILRDLKKFKTEQYKTNECLDKRLTVVETRLDEHIKNS